MRYPSYRQVGLVLVGLIVLVRSSSFAQTNANAEGYITAVRLFADTVIADGRDTYGRQKTPLFVDGLQAESLEPVRWQRKGETWVLCNFASQQPLLRLLDGLTTLTGNDQYRRAAEDATRHALKHLQAPNGLLYWGGHMAWDLDGEKPVGQYAHVHEMKGHQPYYPLMWRVDAPATRKLMEAIWAGHILDWSLLDHNRHAHTDKPSRPQWDHTFDENVEVPFPAVGKNLSFSLVTPSLIRSAVMLTILDHRPEPLIWARRLAYRWQQGNDPKTGLCGGQLSYHSYDLDRAQKALGHVHPDICEAKILATYHSKGRYHRLPLAQMQAAIELQAADDQYADVAREFIQWASADLKTYARYSYDTRTGRFTALMTDGTPIKGEQAKTGYYNAESFAALKPDGFLLWSYALAYRLTRDNAHWQMAREILKQFGLGEVGQADGEGRSLDLNTKHSDWRTVYALLDLYQATNDRTLLTVACRIAGNLLTLQVKTGLFPRPGRKYARTGDEIPLAILHLAAALRDQESEMPAPAFDTRFLHAEYTAPLEDHQKKRADGRTYDHLVFYGDR
jgi:pectate lyase